MTLIPIKPDILGVLKLKLKVSKLLKFVKKVPIANGINARVKIKE